MIFTIADLSVWDIFPWGLFVGGFGIAALLVVFPEIERVWPFSSFSFLGRLKRWNGVALACLVLVIAVPHFLATKLTLDAQQRALETGSFVVVEASFDGRKPDTQLAFSKFPETSLTFEGANYDVPASLHGSVSLLPKIRDELVPGAKYRLSVSGDTLLQIENYT